MLQAVINRLARLIPISSDGYQAFPTARNAFLLEVLKRFWPIFTVIVVLDLLATAAYASTPYLYKLIIDALTILPQSPTSLGSIIVPLIIYIVISLVIRPALYHAGTLLSATTTESALSAHLRHAFTRHQLGQSLSVFQNDFSGRLANQIQEIVWSVRTLLPEMLSASLWIPLSLAINLSLLVNANMALVLPLLVWAIGFGLVQYYFIKPINTLSAAASASRSKAFGHVVDVFGNITTVKLFNHANHEQREVLHHLDDVRQSQMNVQLAYWRLNISSEFMENILEGGTLALAIWLWLHAQITLGDLVMALTIVGQISSKIRQFSTHISNAYDALGELDQNLPALTQPYVVKDAPRAKALNVTTGKVTFEKASFAYHAEQPLVITDLALTIPAGQKVGLVGPSGAGKSTLVNLLLRFYDVTEGKIRIDGHNIAKVTQDSLRAHIGMVTQDTSLLHRSISENIGYGKPDATMGEIIAAAKKAHAHEFIKNLVDKDGNTAYEARVGERGVKLSGGQRQRIAIARLILKDAPILILDEATSALDSEVEQAIQENLHTLMQGKTVIAIAHRLSTIAKLDRLIVLENGRIAEDGTHKDLLKKKGLYARLWSHQSGGFIAEDEDTTS